MVDTHDLLHPEATEIIAVCEQLIERGASLRTTLEETARLAHATIGYRDALGVVQAADSDGWVHHPTVRPQATVRSLSVGGQVFIYRPSAPRTANEFLLGRVAIACTAALRIAALTTHTETSEHTLVDLATAPSSDETTRSRALRLLNLAPHTELRVLLLSTPASSNHDQIAEHILEQLNARGVTTRRSSRDHLLTLILASDGSVTQMSVPVGVRLSIGPAVPGTQLWRSWSDARTGLRFSAPSTHANPPYSDEEAVIIESHRVGCIALLAEHIPASAISQSADVQALDALRDEPGGADMLRTLEAVAATESLRRAAAILHMHHNSVSHRIARAEQTLGFDVTAPYGRTRLLVALILQRLATTDDTSTLTAH